MSTSEPSEPLRNEQPPDREDDRAGGDPPVALLLAADARSAAHAAVVVDEQLERRGVVEDAHADARRPATQRAAEDGPLDHRP